MFIDRRDAGRQLARALEKYKNTNAIVLGIPRGGVVVADEVAQTLNLPLSVIILRKIGAPGNPELAIGATAGHGLVVLNDEAVSALGISQEYIDRAVLKQNEEIANRQQKYLGNNPYPEVEGKTIIIVDDGIATGSSAKAAILAIKKKNPAKVILAVPVAPPDSVNRLAKVADEVVVLREPIDFYAVGQFYQNFTQTTDEEVREVLRARRLGAGS